MQTVKLKSRSEAGFPMKGSRNSSLYSSRQWVEVLNCLLDLKSENRQVWMMLEMNNKWNKSKNTSASNWNRVRAREKAIANTRDLFRGSSTKLYVPAFTAWRISLPTKDLSIKEPPQRNYKIYTSPKYTTPTLNHLHKRYHKANEVYKLLVTTKITNNHFYNFL